jgi:hypothetical protein
MPKTFTIRITKKGKDPRQFMREVSARIYPELQNQIILSSQATAEIMKKILEGSGFRLQSLANSIGVDVLSTPAGVHVGIGNINNFPKGKNGQTYWEAFNDGFKPGAANAFLPLGAFPDGAPDSSKSGGKWLVGAGEYTFFDKNTNKKPIPPLRFVDIAYSDLVAYIQKEILKFSKNLEQASK